MKILLISLLFAFPWATSWAAGLMGKVSDLHGSVTLLDPAAGASPLHAGQSLFEGQTLITRDDGEVHIATIDGAIIALRPNSSLKIEAYRANRTPEDRIHLALIKGALRSITGWVAKLRQDAYQLRTATATIGVRGTDHETIELDSPLGNLTPGVYERVLQGATVVRREQEEIEVREGQVGFIARDRLVRPRLLNEVPTVFKNRHFKLESRLASRREAAVDLPPLPLSDKQIERLRDAQAEKPSDARERQSQTPGETPAEARDRLPPSPTEGITEGRERSATTPTDSTTAAGHERQSGTPSDTTPEQRERLRTLIEDASPEQRDRLRNQLDGAMPEQRDRAPRQIIRRLRPNS